MNPGDEHASPERPLSAAVGAALAATIALAPCVAQAQDYPSKPIRLLIPFPPGGGTDFVSRVVATKLTETLKWQVIPENRPGASGNLAIAEAAKSAPDGYTIVMGQSDNMMLGPWLYPNVGYDTVQSFMPIVQVSEAPLAIVSNAAPPARKLRATWPTWSRRGSPEPASPGPPRATAAWATCSASNSSRPPRSSCCRFPTRARRRASTT
ncbi:MAG: hypothetical protein IPO58_02600 [Betaproteobacteria bacterium]|nr:hypothetical protein [Betaproteobacteria bacterium]